MESRPEPDRPGGTQLPPRGPTGSTAPTGAVAQPHLRPLSHGSARRDDGTGRHPGPAGLPDDERVRVLVDQERYRWDAAGSLVPRPAADIAYRLQSWYGIRGITARQVAEVLNASR